MSITIKSPVGPNPPLVTVYFLVTTVPTVTEDGVLVIEVMLKSGETPLKEVPEKLVAVVPFDENVRKSVRKQKAIVEAFPGSPAAVAIRKLSEKALEWPIPNQPGGHLEFFLEQLISSKETGDNR